MMKDEGVVSMIDGEGLDDLLLIDLGQQSLSLYPPSDIFTIEILRSFVYAGQHPSSQTVVRLPRFQPAVVRLPSG
jgi:hypothetical protein